MDTIIEQLRHYFDSTPRDVIEKEWNSLGLLYKDISPLVEEFIIFIEKEIGVGWKYILKDTKAIKIQKKPSNYSVFLYLCI